MLLCDVEKNTGTKAMNPFLNFLNGSLRVNPHQDEKESFREEKESFYPLT